MPRIRIPEITEFAVRLLSEVGLREPDARRLAHLSVRTEAFGMSTHGLHALSAYTRQAGDRVDLAATPRVLTRTAATVIVDGTRCYGGLAMDLAGSEAEQIARRSGSAVVTIPATTWIAGAGIYVAELAERGLLAAVWVQWNRSDNAGPFGGIDGRFSTNPMALAMPSAPHPVLADFSTTATSHGRMRQMYRRGEKAPEPIFLTRDGTPSDDPATVIDGEGTMLLTGGLYQGYKGFALSLWSEALAAAGGGTCNDADRDDEPAQSCTLWVIDPEATGNGEHFRREFERFCRYVKTSRPRPGHEVRLPGDGAYSREQQAMDHGLTVTDAVWAELEALSGDHGVPLPETR